LAWTAGNGIAKYHPSGWLACSSCTLHACMTLAHSSHTYAMYPFEAAFQAYVCAQEGACLPV
jgi:hypothetical protein